MRSFSRLLSLLIYWLLLAQPGHAQATRSAAVVQLPFDLVKGLVIVRNRPVAIAFIDSVPVQLLLDTGAQDNSLDADFAQNLRVGARPTGKQRETILAPGGQISAQRATLPALQVGTTEWRTVPVVLAPPVRYQSGRALPYQGVIGESFLSQEPLVSFHFGRRQLYFLTPSKP